MFRLVALTCVIAAAASGQQFVDSKNAKILKEQRFNAGDGRAGAAFATEDGHVFREETDGAGNRLGQYSYIGDDGKTYTVKYSAGKDGFRILNGDHIPSGGQGAAAFVRDPDAIVEEEPLPLPAQAIPQPPAPRRQIQPIRPEPQPFVEESAPVDPNFNPFINPHDPTHNDFRFNKNAARFNPNSAAAKQQSLVPPCADCENVNPFVNPFDATHQGGLLAGHLAGHQAGARPAPRAQPAPRRQPQQPLPRPQAAIPQPRFQSTTPPSTRNFPPGTLNLNRFETGFNFDFES